MSTTSTDSTTMSETMTTSTMGSETTSTAVTDPTLSSTMSTDTTGAASSQETPAMGFTTPDTTITSGSKTTQEASTIGSTTSESIVTSGSTTTNEASTMGSTTSDTTLTSGSTTTQEASTIGSTTIVTSGSTTTQEASTMGSTTSDTTVTSGSTTTQETLTTGSTSTVTSESSTTREPSTTSSTTSKAATTLASSTDKESTTISTTDSTTSGSTTTTVSPTILDTKAMSTTMESTTSNPAKSGEPSVKIFVTDGDSSNNNKIFVADLQDQLSFTSIPSSFAPRFITYDSVDNNIYWTDEHDRRVYRADVDGGNRETVTHEGSDERRGIAIAETSRTLYMANTNAITSLSVGDGSTIPGDETVFVDLEGVEPISLEVAEGYLYWTDTGGRIRRISLQGGGAEDLHTDHSLSELYGLSIGPSSGGSLHLFFCDFGTERTFYLEVLSVNEVFRIELTSSLQASTGGTTLRDIAYFNGVLYWTKEAGPSAITVMTDYQDSRSYKIKRTSGIRTPFQLIITTVIP